MSQQVGILPSLEVIHGQILASDEGLIFKILRDQAANFAPPSLNVAQKSELSHMLYPLLTEAASGTDKLIVDSQHSDQLMAALNFLKAAFRDALPQLGSTCSSDRLTELLSKRLADIVNEVTQAIAESSSPWVSSLGPLPSPNGNDDPALIRWLIVLCTLLLFQIRVANEPKHALTDDMALRLERRAKQLTALIRKLCGLDEYGLAAKAVRKPPRPSF